MKNDLIDLLDQAKTKSGSDYRTAAILGVTRSHVSNVRNGKGLDDDSALRLADYLQIDPIIALAAANARRTKDSAMKTRWEQLAGKLVWVLALGITAHFASAHGTTEFLALGFVDTPGYTLCALAALLLGVFSLLQSEARTLTTQAL